MKTFSNRSNAARDARKTLGGDAMINVDFHLVPTKGGRVSWKPGKPESPAKAKAASVALGDGKDPEAFQKVADIAAVKLPAARKGKDINPPKKTKAERALELMRRLEGVTGPELQKELGWLPHTVRGFISGHARKKLGLNVIAETERGAGDDNGLRGACTRYRIAQAK